MKRTLLSVFSLLWAIALTRAETSHLTIEELQQVRLPEVVLQSVTHQTPAGKGSKPHVEVTGVIGEHIRFELLLPDEWNERFAMGGGGGFVGTVQNMARFSVNLGYATVGTDTGHQSQPRNRSEEHTSELQSHSFISYAVFCLKTKQP